MSMFDYIIPEVPMPDGYKGRNLDEHGYSKFQTKALGDPRMAYHRIRKDGQLLIDDSEICGFLTAKITGWITFCDDETGEHRYAAKFTDGILDRIEV